MYLGEVIREKGERTRAAKGKICSALVCRSSHSSIILKRYFLFAVPRRHYSTEGPEFSNLDAVFERISSVKSAEMVKKVNASFVFDVEGDKYHIDFSAGSGDGAAGAGNIPGKPDDFKPDVKITISKENCLKLFNRKFPKFFSQAFRKLSCTFQGFYERKKMICF